MDNYPTVEQCYALFKEYGVLSNIVAHSKMVRKVADTIVKHLKAGTDLEANVVTAAALLHDIAKTETLHSSVSHAERGAEIVASLGYSEIAVAVKNHGFIEEFSIDGPLTLSEVVFYADKRVKHDTVVSVEERIADLLARYGDNSRSYCYINAMDKQISVVERKIESALNCSLEELVNLL